MNRNTVKEIAVFGLHGRRDVVLPVDQRLSIFMGPNGIGKSTIINIFVYAISRQWSRLERQPFTRISIQFISGDSVTIERESCLSLSAENWPTRISEMIQFIFREQMSWSIMHGDFRDFEKRYNDTYPYVTARDYVWLKKHVEDQDHADHPLMQLLAAAAVIETNFPQKLIFLPTFRRIEQDLNEILAISPRSRNRLQQSIDASIDDQSNILVELVRFGMNDIEELIQNHTLKIREFSRQKLNQLSTQYLLLSIRKSEAFNRPFFSSLTDDRVQEIVERVDEKEFDSEIRKSLVELVNSLKRRRSTGRLSREKEQIASFFPLLAAMHDEIALKERRIKDMVDVINKYLMPAKKAHYDQSKYLFEIHDRQRHHNCGAIPLSALSSGEKQIIALFASIALSDSDSLCVVIDEPELSLSVLWQETLVADVLRFENVAKLVAVTHSPFIYGDSWMEQTSDVSEFVKEI